MNTEAATDKEAFEKWWAEQFTRVGDYWRKPHHTTTREAAYAAWKARGESEDRLIQQIDTIVAGSFEDLFNGIT